MKYDLGGKLAEFAKFLPMDNVAVLAADQRMQSYHGLNATDSLNVIPLLGPFGPKTASTNDLRACIAEAHRSCAGGQPAIDLFRQLCDLSGRCASFVVSRPVAPPHIHH